MLYLTEDEYTGIYPEDEITAFSRYARDASRLLDRHTTGVDGVKKLEAYTPTGDSKCAVTMCAAKLVHLMNQIEQLQQAQLNVVTPVQREDGTYQSAVVASRSAGNESISYYNGSNLSQASIIGAAATDRLTREKLFRDTITDGLSGFHDANGVNLLYGGRYPYVY